MDIQAIVDPARFRVIGELGSGGMGVVYRVHDADLDREIALKTLQNLHPIDPDQLYRIKQEFRALEYISHPNLVVLHQLFAKQEPPFFTMELVDGRDVVSYVRDGTPPRAPLDDRGLRRFVTTFRQLVTGVQALHAYGKLHRDIKPSNALVTGDGRVVLLDFGLVAPLEADRPQSHSGSFGGTLAYMAPEQAWGERPSPGADWYSVGVVLFEALTGVEPFEGTIAELMKRKRSTPPRATDIVPGIAQSLDRIITQLLDPIPAIRADGAALLEVLDSLDGDGRTSLPSPALDQVSSQFVGRGEELELLRSSATEVGPGRPSIVHVVGPSGIGKSELVRRYLAEAQRRSTAVTLRGRCHPKESVPYKAFDELVDDLSRHLIQMGERESEQLVPRHAGALLRLFPVLGRVPAFARWRDAGLDLEPHELRRRGFKACRELFERMADRRPLIIWIDDLQWADSDSLPLLKELLTPPDAPGLQILLSYRSEDLETTPVLRVFSHELGEQADSWTQKMHVGPLADTEVHALVYGLLGRDTISGANVQGAQIIARESGGSPFFVNELVRRLRSQGANADLGSGLRLDELVANRVAKLAGGSRRLLEAVSVAGAPIDRGAALDASGLGKGGREIVYALVNDNLLRETVIDEAPAVVPYHDRIREAVLESLSPEARRTCHLRLADALLARPLPDPQILVDHFVGGGDAERASKYAIEAAAIAEQAVAFERAARLYSLAIRLRDQADLVLQLKLANALAMAGRGAEAGPAFEVAVEQALANGVRKPEIMALRRRAGEQYLRGGLVEKGRSAMRLVLDDLSIPGMNTPNAALRTAIRGRLWAALRWFVWGTPFTVRSEDQIPPATLERIDALWAASTSLGNVDHLTADALGVRTLHEVLHAGEPSRAARALAYEASFESRLHRRFRKHAEKLLAHASRLCEQNGSQPYDRAWIGLATSIMHWCNAEWRASVEAGQQAVDTFRQECRGTAWEVAQCHMFLLSGLGNRGECRRLVEATEEAHRDATARGDRFAANINLLGTPALRRLITDEPERLLREGDEAIQMWSGTDEFHVQHYLHLVSTVPACLYLGSSPPSEHGGTSPGWEGWRRITGSWRALDKNGYLMLEILGTEIRYIRARAALGAALSTRPPPATLAHWTPEKLRSDVRRQIADIRRKSRLPTTEPFASGLEAGLASLDGNRQAALDGWTHMADSSARADMDLHHHAAQLRLAALLGDSAGNELRKQSLAWMEREGVRNPAAILGTIAPSAVV